jgi:hypothetical protein
VYSSFGIVAVLYEVVVCGGGGMMMMSPEV